ncbi:MAG: hypothetical protein DRN04_08085 [Thermoprotei archaeon]|nr:MAG: hypothetical protein DRN04_08085 [Thermoprotei archaeon]
METLKLMEAIVSTVTVLAFIASIFFSPIFFAVTAIPGLAYLIYVWRKDRIEREPLFMVFAVFSYGFIVSTLVSLIAETSLGELAEPVMTIPVVEELAKFIGVYLVSMRRTVFNELDDGIVYGAASGLGFATLEAIIYAFQEPFVFIGLLRAISSTLVHAASSAVFGYFYAVSVFYKRKWSSLEGFLVACFLHSLHNALIKFGLALLIIPLDMAAFIIVVRKLK